MSKKSKKNEKNENLNDQFDGAQEISADKKKAEPLSDEEKKILSSTQDGFDRSTLPNYDNSDLAKAKRYAKKNKFTVGFVVATVILLVAVIAALSVLLYLENRDAPSTDDFTLTLGDDEHILKYKSAMRDDVLYLDIVQIARYTDLIISGDVGALKISCSDGTYARFEQGKNTAIVNGERVKLDGKAEIVALDSESEGKMQCFVPYSFIEGLFSNEVVSGTTSVHVSFSDRTNKIIIHRISYKDSGEPLPISFSADCFDLVTLSLLPYENYPPSADGAARAFNSMTLLVNKNNPLGEFFTPKGLISLKEIGCPVIEGRELLLEATAARALAQMLSSLGDALGQSAPVKVTSAYRSYSYQRALHELYVQRRIDSGYSRDAAEADALRTSARAGESEHQSGLCVDLVARGEQLLSRDFANTAAYEWLCDNAHRYGYILRYPKGKEEITGYEFEPWHYRFVGVDAARVIYEDKICLEEYLAAF